MPISTSCAAAATAAERLPFISVDSGYGDLRVIRLESPIHRLHGIVHRDLHERDVDDADRAGAAGRDRGDGDFIPVDHGVGARRVRARGEQRTSASNATWQGNVSFS